MEVEVKSLVWWQINRILFCFICSFLSVLLKTLNETQIPSKLNLISKDFAYELDFTWSLTFFAIFVWRWFSHRFNPPQTKRQLADICSHSLKQFHPFKIPAPHYKPRSDPSPPNCIQHTTRPLRVRSQFHPDFQPVHPTTNQTRKEKKHRQKRYMIPIRDDHRISSLSLRIYLFYPRVRMQFAQGPARKVAASRILSGPFKE